MRIPRPLPFLLLALAGLAGPARAQVPAPTPPPAAAATVRAGAAALRPAEVVAPPGGPTILMLPVEGSPRAALRVSVPVEEGPSEGGAARILQLLALERARAAASPAGAQVEATRTPWGVAYTVEGAAADFDQLAYVLREALAAPPSGGVAFERARGQALREALRLRETAAGRMAATLRQRVIPGQRLVEGTPATVRGIDHADLRDLWRRTHQRERMSLVIVGDVPSELVLASFRGVGADAGEAAEPPSAPAPTDEGARTQVIRSWYGEAREAGDLRDPRGLVAAALVSGRLQVVTDGRTETRLDVWEIGGRRVLAVTAAAYPGEGSGLQALVGGVLGDAFEAADRDAVRDAVGRVRAALLLGARTPSGLARLVGRYHDATGDPEGAAVLVEALDQVDATSLRAFLGELAESTPVRAELRR